METDKAKMPTIEDKEFADSMRAYDNHRRKRAIKALFERGSTSIELRDMYASAPMEHSLYYHLKKK